MRPGPVRPGPVRGGPVRVVMVGNGPRGLGGVASVARLFQVHAGPLDGVRLRYVETYRDGPAAVRVGVFLLGALRVLALLLARRVDVLHLHVTERASLVRKGLLLRAAAALGVPVVLHCHGAEFADELATMGPRGRRLLHGVFSRAADVVVLGESQVPVVAAAGADPALVRVAANPVELPPSLPVRPVAERLPVLFLGRLSERKGVPDLLAALAALPAGVRDAVSVRLFGDGDVAAVAGAARDLGLGAAVTVHGWLDPAARDAELARAEVFVLPSHNEGLPMALLEAMAWGLVPVVTPVGGIPAVVREDVSGLLVDPGDRTALAAAITRLVGDPALRARLAAGARSAAGEHDVTGYALRWRSAWESLAGAAPR